VLHVLDTNTVSYALRGEPAVVDRLRALTPADVAVPAIVVYELRYGLARLPRASATPRLAALSTFLAPMRVLDFDQRCAERAATVRAELEAAGTPIGPHDVLIAATALAHGAALVTHKVREFCRVRGLTVLDWLPAE